MKILALVALSFLAALPATAEADEAADAGGCQTLLSQHVGTDPSLSLAS